MHSLEGYQPANNIGPNLASWGKSQNEKRDGVFGCRRTTFTISIVSDSSKPSETFSYLCANSPALFNLWSLRIVKLLALTSCVEKYHKTKPSPVPVDLIHHLVVLRHAVVRVWSGACTDETSNEELCARQCWVGMERSDRIPQNRLWNIPEDLMGFVDSMRGLLYSFCCLSGGSRLSLLVSV